MSRSLHESRAFLIAALFLLVIGAVAVFRWITVPARTEFILQDPAETYVRGWHFWEPLFREPVETAIFVFRDGRAFSFTSFLDKAVEGTEAQYIEYFAKMGRSPEDILIIIHNHLYSFTFSECDKRSWRYLRDCGFTGHFLLYRPGGEVIELED